MTGIYLCQYITNNKKICNKPCYRQEGCAIVRKTCITSSFLYMLNSKNKVSKPSSAR